MTKKTNRAGDANRAITLQALRAGPMTSMEIAERWTFGSRFAQELRNAGLVELVDDEWRITPAGRAACPYRNPKAAEVAAPEIFTMPKGESRLTRQRVLEAIRAAGPDGLGRAELIVEFAHLASEQSVDMHLGELEKPKMAAGGYVPLGEKYSDRLPTFIPVVEDIRISDPETVEFCIYSSGGLDIFSDDAPPITLDKHVLAKLRGFLGLFQEAV